MALNRKSRAAALSIGSNSCLVAGKLVVGLLSGSVSIVAEALHSGIDLVAAVIAFFSVRIADRPADRDHPFGHGKAEAISGAIEALLIVLAAVWIIYEAVHRLRVGGKVEQMGLAMGVMIASAVINWFLSRYLLKVARQEDSLALEADGHHLSTDTYTSLGVAVGVGLVWATGYTPIDAIAALAVAIWIAWIGWRLTVKATDQLMDRGLPAEEIALIQAVLDEDGRCQSFHSLRTRKSGAQRHVIVHVVCEGDLPLRQAHQVADELERKIADALTPAFVTIHLDPEDATD